MIIKRALILAALVASLSAPARAALNASIDTGVAVATQTTVAFTPDRNGTADNVFIRFTHTGIWRVEISSTAGFTAINRVFYGSGTAVVVWDGYVAQLNGVGPQGNYFVRISTLSGANYVVADTSLSATLNTIKVKGFVKENGSLTPLADADIGMFGPTSHYTRSDSSGFFEFFGAQASSYTIRIKKTGYADKQYVVSVSSPLTDTGDNLLTKASKLRLSYTRTLKPVEVWGQVTAHTPDWSLYSHGTVHFTTTNATSDAGDYYNTNLTTYTELSLIPGVTYFIRTDVPGNGVGRFSVNLGTGVIVSSTVALSPRADISGTVDIGSATNTNGMFVSVTVWNSTSPQQRFYGGAYLTGGQSSGTYQVRGVTDGGFTMEAQAPGLVTSTQTVTIVSAGDQIVNFPVFSAGKVIGGSITVNGDTFPLDSLDGSTDGKFYVYVQAYSPSTYRSAVGAVQLTCGSIGSSGSYQVTGLAAGQYNVFTWLPGFEISPPGPKNVTVTGSSVTLNITMNAFSGQLQGSVLLPGGATDYANVTVKLKSNQVNYSQQQTPNTGGTFLFTGLGTAFYQLQAEYSATSGVFQKSLSLKNSTTSTVTVDLSPNTYLVSGTVTTTATMFPANSIVNAVNASTPTTITFQDNSTVTLSANRVVAVRLSGAGGPSESPLAGLTTQYEQGETYFAYFSTSGYYQMKLSPGVYRLSLNGEYNGNVSGGREAAGDSEIITIKDQPLVRNLSMKDGVSVSGVVKLPDGVTDLNRKFIVALLNERGDQVLSQEIQFTGGQTMPFNLQNATQGNFSLTAFDNGVQGAPQRVLRWASASLPVTVGADPVSDKTITVRPFAKVIGRISVKTSATSETLLTNQNYQQFLPNNFFIYGRPNPPFAGGFANVEHPIINSDGLFTLLIHPDYEYDVVFRSNEVSDEEIAQGKQVFTPLTIAGIKAGPGLTKDLGVIKFVPGAIQEGVITDTASAKLANIFVRAFPSDGSNRNQHEEGAEGITDNNGRYVLRGLNSSRTYDVVAAPRPDSRDTRFSLSFEGSRYAEVRRYGVTPSTTALNFTLERAPSVIVGTVTTQDGGVLISPFNRDAYPGAQIILRKENEIPLSNPLGNIEANTQPDGRFQVDGLTDGSYRIYVIARGYASRVFENVKVEGTTSLGTIVLSTGSTLTGTIKREDDSPVNQNQYEGLIAFTQGFGEILGGFFETDGSGNILSYKISGFKQNTPYEVILAGEDDDIITLSSTVVMTANQQTRDFIVRDRSPEIFAQTLKGAGGKIDLVFTFASPLSNSDDDTDDNGIQDSRDPDEIFTLTGGSGTLTIDPDEWLSSDGKTATMAFTPTTQVAFTIVVNATFSKVDPTSGKPINVSKSFTFYPGIGRQASKPFSSATGGTVLLDDGSQFSAQPGSLKKSNGTNDNDLEIILRSADSASGFSTSASGGARGRGALAAAKRNGLAAYPSEMGDAIKRTWALSVDPFSSFYDVFLPAGVSHLLSQPAQLCLSYDSDTQDPDNLNLYYYNSSRNEYTIENRDRVVDTVNNRVCVSLSHASTFVIFNSNASVISGDAYSGELKVYNFPNPFDLKTKTVSLQNPGSNSASQSVRGTLIKMSIPSRLSGEIEIDIYTVSGQKVRTLNANVAGGAHYYLEWDGRNDAGRDVASGTYLARFRIAGGNERIFKMAVLK